MSRPWIALAALALSLTLTADLAWADLPPPPGVRRVDYIFQIDAVPEGYAAIAFPGYDLNTGASVVSLQASAEVRSVQGYTPGIYVLPPADAAALAGKSDDAVRELLDARALRCLQQIPRVFQVPESTRIATMTDVIHLEVKDSTCQATLVVTRYEGPDGERGEGGVDTRGERTPPAPFGPAPNVADAGFVLANAAAPAPAATQVASTPEPASTAKPASTPPPTTGTCAVGPADDRTAALALLLLACAAPRRRRGASRR